MAGKIEIGSNLEFHTIVAGLFLVIHDNLLDKFVPFMNYRDFYPDDKSNASESLRSFVHVITRAHGSGKKVSILHLNSLIKESILDHDQANYLIDVVYGWRGNENITEKVGSKETTMGFFIKYIKCLYLTREIRSHVQDQIRYLDLNHVENKLSEALSNCRSLGVDPNEDLTIEDIEAYLNNKESDICDKLFLGDDEIDNSVYGFRPQTLTIFLGSTGTGKSTMAAHIVRRCIEQELYVWVGVLEDAKNTFIERILSAISYVPRSTIKNKTMTKEQKEAVSVAYNKLLKYCKVQFIRARDIDTIHKYAIEYDAECDSKKKPKPVVNIVDYTGHIAAKSAGDKTYEQYRAAYAARKDYALKHNKICFDFAQTNRAGALDNKNKDNNILGLTELASSYDLAQVADYIISLNRSERDAQQRVTRLFVAKARDCRSNFTSIWGDDFEYGRFIANWEKIQASAQNDLEKNLY